MQPSVGSSPLTITPTQNRETSGTVVILFGILFFGRERGDSGTPHLQGFFILHNRLRQNQVSQLGGLRRASLDKANGTPAQAAAYCKKEGDFEKIGELPQPSSGKRSDWESFKEWVKAQRNASDRSWYPWELSIALWALQKGNPRNCGHALPPNLSSLLTENYLT